MESDTECSDSSESYDAASQQLPTYEDGTSFIAGDEKSVSENSSLTRGQLLALVIAFFLRHKLTKVALRD